MRVRGWLGIEPTHMKRMAAMLVASAGLALSPRPQ